MVKSLDMIYLATDHKGFELKEKVKEFLLKEGYPFEDFGAFEFDKNDDYPDFISKAAQAVSIDPESFGIIFGNSGQGEAMVANKYKNVRAAIYYGGQSEMLKLTREHNGANILSLGAKFLSEEETMSAIKLFLDTPFTQEERHLRRVKKIHEIENNK